MGQSTDAIMGWGVAFSEDGADYDAIERAEYRLEKEGVEAEYITHCSGNCPMLAIVIPETRRKAWRGSPVKFDDAIAITRESWGAAIRRALAVYLEEVEAGGNDEGDASEPLSIGDDDLGWWLFSDWS